MKALRLARAFGGAFALVMVIAPVVYAGSVLPLPSVSGPSLGDPTTNISSIMQALQNNTYSNYFSYTTLTIGASATTGATQMQYGVNFLTAASGTTPTVALPTAKPGANIIIINNTAQGLNIIASPNPFTVGLTDGINGTFGSPNTPYQNASNGKIADCWSPVGGSWWCASGN